MKAADIFQDCYARYRSLREWLADSTGSIRSIELGKPFGNYLWRPDRTSKRRVPLGMATPWDA